MKKTMSANAAAAGSFVIAGDMKVHRMGFGAMRLTGPGIWGDPPNRKEAHNVLKRAIEMGVNLIDTADSYGPEVNENIIAEALYPYPKNLVIATKGGLTRKNADDWSTNCRPEYLMQCVEKSLRRLRLECIDLYQLHAVDPKVPLEDSIGALKKMQDQGKIRYIGLSNVSVSEIQRAKKIIEVVSIQNRYNIADRSSEDVLKYCEKNKMGFIPWFPMGSGDLAQPGSPLDKFAKLKDLTPAQVALAWLLQHSPAMLPIPGTSSLKHLEEDIAAASIEFSSKEMSELDLISENL